MEIEALFAQTLVEPEDEAWAAVSALHAIGSREVFELAAKWCQSPEARRREMAAAILGQLRSPAGRLFREEALAAILHLLETEQDSAVLCSALASLGHLDNPSAIPAILVHLNHPDEPVRFDVAFALGCFPNDPRSVDGLVTLTWDPSAHVRDWAVFGLGVQGDADSPAIRETLLRCLDDVDEDVSEEAAVGLGKRQDPRVVPKLAAMLDRSGVGGRAAEAAVAALGLEREPENWTAADYKSALIRKFR